ncbi:hypothetical protein CK203_000109 [Vitis vinifera]|uniref:Uncharacterized protein n=1 Tax=Vitis vinifera TaxID=29760 RepID=A0A438KQJ9_VITVI|nr:hypothetical protein CK203_000109 [Vitis vinifera]
MLDARIMSWLLGSVEPHIVTHLRPHRSAQSMWAYLKKVYHQDNDACRFQLEHAIAMFQHADDPIAALSTIQTIHATTRRDYELLREEQRLSTQAILEQSHGSSKTATVAYPAQGRGPPMHSKNLRKGHIIKEYRIRPQNRQAQAFQTSVIIPPVTTSTAHDSPLVACSVPAPPAPDYCTPKMVQRMLISALSAMGFQGNNSTKLCSLPIAAIGDASSKFTDVFLAPQLSTNLISVGQLVDNNCAVNFSGNGCVVQDQDIPILRSYLMY